MMIPAPPAFWNAALLVAAICGDHGRDGLQHGVALRHCEPSRACCTATVVQNPTGPRLGRGWLAQLVRERACDSVRLPNGCRCGQRDRTAHDVGTTDRESQFASANRVTTCDVTCVGCCFAVAGADAWGGWVKTYPNTKYTNRTFPST